MLLSAEPCLKNEEELDPYNIQQPVILEEWKTYFVRFYETPPDFFLNLTRSSFITRTFDNLNLFEIAYKNYTGISRLGNLSIYVKNQKIGEKLYERLLDYISDKFSNLIFAFDESYTASNYKSDISKDDISYLKFFLIKPFLNELEGIYNLIIKEPHRLIVQEEHLCDISDSNYIDINSINRIFLNQKSLVNIPENHRLAKTNLALLIKKNFNKSLFLTKSYKTRKYYDLDTPENRFILYFTQLLYNYFDELKNNLKATQGTYLNNDLLIKVNHAHEILENILSNPLWKEVGQLNLIPFGSTILQKKEGYRQLFTLYSLFQLTVRFEVFQNDFKNIIENKDTALLYEYWCFFQLKDILDCKLKLKKIVPIVINSTFKQDIVEGIALTYEPNVIFYFNKTFIGRSQESYSLNYRPDFTIVNNSGQKLLFDAKNKGMRNNNFYGDESEGDITTYKQEDIDKMHTYKDAINNVYGAFILYPGLKTEIFPCHNCQKGHFNGVGAIALKPKDENHPYNNEQQEGFNKLIEIIDNFLGDQ